MASGLKQIKKELGPDALILSTRTVRGGALGLLGKPMLEITAAVDHDFTPGPGRQAGQAAKPPDNGKEPRPGGFRQVVDDEVLPWLHQQPAKAEPQPPAPPAEPVVSEPGLHSEVNELKSLVKNLAAQIAGISRQESEAERRNTLAIRDSRHAERLGAGPIQGDHLLSLLIDYGIHIESARTIAGFLRESLTAEELSDPALVREQLITTIQNLLEVIPPQTGAGGGQQRLALIGPTGVGKTTTLAKIAASRLATLSGSIALITIDTYRIAAVEQLKVYGEIMHLPVEVVNTPDELREALARHQEKELVLIDTAGRSPRDSLSIDELAGFFQADLGIDKYLVLSATTREDELLETISRFSPLQIDNTIFTKVDECRRLGVLLNVQIHNPSPLTYITNGQRVPEDILAMTPRLAAELIISAQQEGLHG